MEILPAVHAILSESDSDACDLVGETLTQHSFALEFLQTKEVIFANIFLHEVWLKVEIIRPALMMMISELQTPEAVRPPERGKLSDKRIIVFSKNRKLIWVPPYFLS